MRIQLGFQNRQLAQRFLMKNHKHHLDGLFTQVFEPKGQPKANVIVVHGIGEHCQRHLNTIKFLVGNGLRCITFDFRGHGKSQGEPQYINSFEDYVIDLERIVKWSQSQYSEPFFLQAHSLGGAVALSYVGRGFQQKSFSGIAINAPAFKTGEGLSWIKVAIGKQIGKFFPKFKIPKPIANHSISRDPKVLEDLEQDPFNYGFHTARQGIEILSEMPKLADYAKKLEVPVFYSHGTDDVLILAHGTEELFRSTTVDDKTLYLHQGGFHETHNEPDKELYFEKLLDWIMGRIEKS